MATLATFRRIAPELAIVTDDDAQGFLDDAAAQLSKSTWGSLYDQAHARLAAHLTSLSRPDLAGAAGPVTSESVGDLSRSYAAPASTQVPAAYAGSRHGIAFFQLQRRLGLSVMVI